MKRITKINDKVSIQIMKNLMLVNDRFKNLLRIGNFNFVITLQENLGNSYYSHILNFQLDSIINTWRLNPSVSYVYRFIALLCLTKMRKILFTVFTTVFFSVQIECKWFHFSWSLFSHLKCIILNFCPMPLQRTLCISCTWNG